MRFYRWSYLKICCINCFAIVYAIFIFKKTLNSCSSNNKHVSENIVENII